MSGKRIVLLALTLSVLSLFSVSTAFATTYYVKNGGNDSLSGLSPTDAWANAPGMVGWTGTVTLAPGDQVLFNRGDTWTFTSDPNGTSFAIPTSGTASNPIFFGAYGTGNRPVFDGNGLKEWYGMISMKSISYVTIDNWDLTNSQYQTMQVWGPNSTGVVVQNCVFHDNTAAGFELVEIEGTGVVGGVTNITFNNNLFYNGMHDGLKLNDGVTYAVISNNVFHNIQHNSIDTLSVTSPSQIDSNFQIYGNDIYAAVQSSGADGMYIPGLENSVIYDNTIHDFVGVGIQSDSQVFPATNDTIRNNVFWNLTGSGNYALWFTGGNTGINIWNNTIYGSNCPNISDGGESYANNLAYNNTADVNQIKNLGSNPLFVDPTGSPPNFQLQAGSPAIDAGVNVGLPYSGSAPDLGAYEYSGTTASQPIAAPTGLRVLPSP